MNIVANNQIKQFFSNRNIINRKLLSQSFGMNCEKITLEHNKSFVAKYYINNDLDFNSIVSETKSMRYLIDRFPNLFPKIRFSSDKLLIMDYIKSNNIKNNDYQVRLAKEILNIHKVNNDRFGFMFDAQIGGLRQKNNFQKNWINFFINNRLNDIFELINKKESMPKKINYKIEKLMNDIENRLPKFPNISLLHGDMWEGNILFNNGDLVGLIDPGIFFGHNEMEIAYLTWFKYIDETFLDFYSNEIKIDKNYKEYESIYQIYYSLLNVYLWERDYYLKDVDVLLDKVI